MASPLGAPVVSSQLLWRIATGIVAIAGTLYPLLPAHTLVAKACLGIIGLGAAIGIASPGLRKPAVAEPPPLSKAQALETLQGPK